MARTRRRRDPMGDAAWTLLEIDATIGRLMAQGRWQTLEARLNDFGRRLGVTGLDVLQNSMQRTFTAITLDDPEAFAAANASAEDEDLARPPASLAEALGNLRRAAARVGRSVQ